MNRLSTVSVAKNAMRSLIASLAFMAAGAVSASAPEPVAMKPQDRNRAAVIEVVIQIARGADLHLWNSVRAGFAPQVVLDYGSAETLTPSDIVARWQPLLEALDATQHTLSDMEVTINGDKATVRSAFRAVHWLQGAAGGDVWTLTGRYEHDLVRQSDGWQITRMKMIPGGSTGNDRLLELAGKAGKP